MDNGVNKALISNAAIALNMKKLPEWGLMLKLQNAFKKVGFREIIQINSKNICALFQVTIVPLPPPFMGRKNLRLDDVLAFIDDGVLVMSAMDAATKAKIISEIYKRERKEVKFYKIWKKFINFNKR